MKDVTELQIYKRAMDLLPRIYELVNQLPRNEFELKSQVCNSAKAISAQITEGFAKKNSQNEFKRFLYMALGSSDETITHLWQIRILNFSNVNCGNCDALIEEYKVESKQINSLIQKIRNPISNV
ncbi:four helix bundle protein [Candidatus Jorgensenbacteria bacterium CG_4_10_14_0_8_um_filter_39_13]|uniref:Four helix bundle protein n=2 Tax=Candidatus Joergenseniibacteriota TaxID=1752739 RepID=A0A2M7RFJ6_9BACT|nr:MAG: four helix bundle protein [Candidatus Jorgensenbacteria bacterium CG11_big_fil_rev_8_21_14_0_20_38_23]PIV13123.1 MAG: four helix bundle protein [Candidatus Jorgensenbacteria bacterium CG03_land_8_20_14_0_80_38_39]PIW97840.1 MAG: four helix bundle protein [Candidatus Jorgensenbacteria bacterium CG_4_8_14_3_um_filter_38_10]PIY95523.1 MAG: four helix bundle protein [Candidatus Jorgensenbacteria bacterium CG_4_10_14_0_8_um_filter_39_13]PJA94924.1 MAG: four helix bundle protein [Candidatus J